MLASPYNEPAERSVLGAVMLYGFVAMNSCLKLKPGHFYSASHGQMFAACIAILAEQDDISPALVCERMKYRFGSAEWIYIDSLTDGIYRGFDPAIRVESIMEAWRLRKVMTMCERFTAECSEGLASADVLSAMHAEVLSVIDDSLGLDDPLVSAYSEQAWESLMERAFAQEPMGLSYGCSKLDAWTYGMQDGRVTAVGARSGVGKTSLMKQATAANCKKDIPVTLFSLEATREELLNGLWAIVSGVEARKIERSNLMLPDERERVQAAMRTVSKWPLRIYDKSDLHIDQICAYARKDIRQHKARLIGVDYAQNVEADGKDERTKVSSVSRKLTKMTKDEGNALILLSQLRKVPIEHYSKPPTMADFRETGQIENDAHVGLLLHRGWDEEACCISDDAAIHIGKFRQGRTGAIKVRFNPENLCFE